METMVENKAKVTFKNGWVLKFPKNGLAPMLFLEWLCEFKDTKCSIYTTEKDSEYFLIRLHAEKKYYTDACKYINLNL